MLVGTNGAHLGMLGRLLEHKNREHKNRALALVYSIRLVHSVARTVDGGEGTGLVSKT